MGNTSDDESAHRQDDKSLSEVLLTLPLFNELYLRMQAYNIEILDQFLVEEESKLLREYFELERTPIPTTMFVSALSQFWLFGLYELLRTWRQRGRAILRWHKEWQLVPLGERESRLKTKRLEMERLAANPEVAMAFNWPPYEEVARNDEFADRLRRALDGAERLFKRIEAFRVSLAKHEMPGATGSFAEAPGYGRIDMPTGSIYWQVVLRGNEVDLVSRREIANQCRALSVNVTSRRILPEAIQVAIKNFPEESYGVKRIAATLEDGTEISGLRVAWCKEIVGGLPRTPFDADLIIDATPDPSS